jgi:hypothetical protein
MIVLLFVNKIIFFLGRKMLLVSPIWLDVMATGKQSRMFHLLLSMYVAALNCAILDIDDTCMVIHSCRDDNCMLNMNS